MKCLFDGNCKIDINTRRFCPFCRLKQCFSAGMKKELILGKHLLRLFYSLTPYMLAVFHTEFFFEKALCKLVLQMTVDFFFQNNCLYFQTKLHFTVFN